MVRYHKRSKGRPVQYQVDSNPNNVRVKRKRVNTIPNSPTDEFKLKKGFLLHGYDGSIECPIDILCAQRIITKEQAEAIKVYGLVWASAFGKPRKYSGNVWAGLIDGFGREFKEESDGDIDALRKRRDRYESIDKIVLEYGDEVRRCLRSLCEGHMPYYFKDCIYNASRTYKLDIELEVVEDKLKELSQKSDKQSKIDFDSLIHKKKTILKKLEVFSADKEPYFNVYIREQLRLALKRLCGLFGLN